MEFSNGLFIIIEVLIICIGLYDILLGKWMIKFIDPLAMINCILAIIAGIIAIIESAPSSLIWLSFSSSAVWLFSSFLNPKGGALRMLGIIKS